MAMRRVGPRIYAAMTVLSNITSPNLQIMLGIASSQQVFVPNNDWGVCFATRSSNLPKGALSFQDRTACEVVLLPTNAFCKGPGLFNVVPTTKDKSMISLNIDCNDVTCPETHECSKNPIVACCSKKVKKMLEEAESETCPSGSKAGKVKSKNGFQAVFGQKCEDLICMEGQKCVQINENFAKCCGSA
ncbi:hypothetical protein L596_030236 [Steinernema carpocapsae]|uniref:Uncharacterized protein n=1 Tax=Steinernema carpocapsae TaxID=34508 RepID=A0A4V5ZX91_STECR|nr:hypothetical protein L596_030236 [Steinernema carpocapsae]